MKLEEIGPIRLTSDRPFLIAEAGVNHEGSLERAIEMVDAAAEAGADMIKFQSYKAETLASRNSPAYWDRSKEPAESQYALFKRFDALNVDDYVRLHDRCTSKGILFCTTPFDTSFVDSLDRLLPLYKVASADITNEFLLRHIARKGKPVLLSTGASTVGEIEAAARLLQREGCEQIGLLHCILEYPTNPSHANLLSIPYLQRVFPDVAIGWSDHVPPSHGCLSLLTAWMLGASILEKHFTLDKSLPGNDHYHAMDPDDVRAFRQQQELMRAMLGREEKRVFACETEARKQARRSLVATRDIAKGELIQAEMLTAKRPGTGMPPEAANLIIGRAAPADLAADEVLQWDVFLGLRSSREP